MFRGIETLLYHLLNKHRVFFCNSFCKNSDVKSVNGKSGDVRIEISGSVFTSKSIEHVGFNVLVLLEFIYI